MKNCFVVLSSLVTNAAFGSVLPTSLESLATRADAIVIGVAHVAPEDSVFLGTIDIEQRLKGKWEKSVRVLRLPKSGCDVSAMNEGERALFFLSELPARIQEPLGKMSPGLGDTVLVMHSGQGRVPLSPDGQFAYPSPDLVETQGFSSACTQSAAESEWQKTEESRASRLAEPWNVREPKRCELSGLIRLLEPFAKAARSFTAVHHTGEEAFLVDSRRVRCTNTRDSTMWGGCAEGAKRGSLLPVSVPPLCFGRRTDFWCWLEAPNVREMRRPSQH